MAEDIDLEKCNFWNLRSPVTLTLDWVIWHTVVHHLSTSIYTTNFTEIGNFLWTEVRTDVPTDGHFRLPLMLLGRLGGVNLKITYNTQFSFIISTMQQSSFSQSVSTDASMHTRIHID